jgi:hypothetical protein
MGLFGLSINLLIKVIPNAKNTALRMALEVFILSATVGF